mgnify:CR=1 FL=1
MQYLTTTVGVSPQTEVSASVGDGVAQVRIETAPGAWIIIGTATADDLHDFLTNAAQKVEQAAAQAVEREAAAQ